MKLNPYKEHLIKQVMDNGLKEMMERFKVKAEIFLKNNTKAFIVDTKDDWHFCYIILVGEDFLEIQHFEGDRKAEFERIYWTDIFKFEEYREVRE